MDHDLSLLGIVGRRGFYEWLFEAQPPPDLPFSGACSLTRQGRTLGRVRLQNFRSELKVRQKRTRSFLIWYAFVAL